MSNPSAQETLRQTKSSIKSAPIELDSSELLLADALPGVEDGLLSEFCDLLLQSGELFGTPSSTLPVGKSLSDTISKVFNAESLSTTHTSSDFMGSSDTNNFHSHFESFTESRPLDLSSLALSPVEVLPELTTSLPQDSRIFEISCSSNNVSQSSAELQAPSSGTLAVSFIAGGGIGAVRAVDLATGALTVDAAAAGFSPSDLAFGPNGNLFVGNSNTIEQFDQGTGTYLGPFASNPSGVSSIAFGPNGNLFAIGGSSTVQQFNGTTGASLGTFASGITLFPNTLNFGPDGNLYVNNIVKNSIVQIDGMTGAILGTVAFVGAPQDLTFDSNGNLYVISGDTIQARGALNGTFVSGLSTPTDLAFGPNGNLFVTNAGK